MVENQNKHELISIIVPVYNVECFINECISSLIAQTYRNIEILLIDDGSTDSSLSRCYEWKKKDKRIRVYTKENEGLGLTRNFGIEQSKGTYISFVDSDDYLLPDAIESMYKEAVRTDADVVSAKTIYKDEPIVLSVEEGVYSHKRIMKHLINKIMGNYPGKNDAYTYTATAKLFKLKTILNSKVRFPSERKLIWEDLVFSTLLFPKCNSIYIMSKPVYYYRFNECSLTHKYVPKKFEKIIILYQYMCRRIIEYGLSKEAKLRLNNNFLGHIRTCIKLEVYYSGENGKKYAYSRIKRICEDETVNDIIASIPIRTYNKSQRIYSYFIVKKKVKCVYFLTWLQNKKKRID